MKYRPINTNFWNDDYILSLNDKEIKAFIFLFSNDKVTKAGIYKLPERWALFILNIEVTEWNYMKTKFETDRKYYFFKDWVYIANFAHHNKFSPAENVIKSLAHEFNSVPAEIRNHYFTELNLPYVIPIQSTNKVKVEIQNDVMVKVKVMVIVNVMVNSLGGRLGSRLDEDINPDDVKI